MSMVLWLHRGAGSATRGPTSSSFSINRIPVMVGWLETQLCSAESFAIFPCLRTSVENHVVVGGELVSNG